MEDGLGKIISGGQTGVDRAALDVAAELGLARGGWVPRGRRAEDGPVDVRYPLVETPSDEYRQRTSWNVRDSDGTLVLVRGKPSGGTAFTLAEARRQGRPCLVVDLEAGVAPAALAAFVAAAGIRVLNVAGPRESGAPGIGAEAAVWLRAALMRPPRGRTPKEPAGQEAGRRVSACGAGRSRPAR